MNIERIKELREKTVETLHEEGIKSLVTKGKNFIYFRLHRNKMKATHEFKDILFINGCSLPHPQRYRVDHQIEQLQSYGISCAKVDYDKVTLDLVKYFRGFVIYRCPITPDIEQFIKLAKENNKVTFYDIDDLVFDLQYTKKLKCLDSMSEEERELYNNGVLRMGKTLELCDYGIASTNRLQTEMSKKLKDVYVNRNVASESMAMFSQKALKIDNKEKDKIIMGYLSGTITHNDDFKMIMPVMVELLKKYDNLYLKIVGLLDLPVEMECVKDKIITAPFMNWKKLPELIHSIDINLAPLEQSVFNEAKSENKWTEAALVKVPTVASNVGAFKDSIVDGETGLLCNTKKEWKEKLSRLIENQEYRKEIGNKAYQEVMACHITTNSGKGVADFITSKLNKNICFVLPSTNISGGILVATKHALLLKNKGYDVTIINAENSDEDIINKDGNLYVIPACKTVFTGYIDTLVATMWLTLEFVKKYDNCSHKKYLVQGMETQIYKYGEFERVLANATYNNVQGIEYITISKWCQEWLSTEFKNNVKYAPNGIDLSLFPFSEKTFEGKIKILIEGNRNDYLKNVDESFKIVDKLDKERFEIHYLSYEKEPKKTYYIDKFYHKIPHDEVGKIYQKCDILIKTSLLESFSYPPLEMMATGGICVAIQNCGNKEYLVNNENCLIYEQGNIDEAVEKIEQICQNKKLRDKLIKNGYTIAKKREWKNLEDEIISLYI